MSWYSYCLINWGERLYDRLVHIGVIVYHHCFKFLFINQNNTILCFLSFVICFVFCFFFLWFFFLVVVLFFVFFWFCFFISLIITIAFKSASYLSRNPPHYNRNINFQKHFFDFQLLLQVYQMIIALIICQEWFSVLFVWHR